MPQSKDKWLNLLKVVMNLRVQLKSASDSRAKDCFQDNVLIITQSPCRR